MMDREKKWKKFCLSILLRFQIISRSDVIFHARAEVSEDHFWIVTRWMQLSAFVFLGFSAKTPILSFRITPCDFR